MKVISLILLLLTAPGLSWAATTTLRVLTYNIHHGEGTDGVIDLDRLAKIIDSTQPELVALQEIDQDCTRSGNIKLANELARRLKMDSRFGRFMKFQGGEYGLAVLSRLPIVASRRIELPPGEYEPRCALEVTVMKKNSPLSFVSIHNDWINEDIRLKQVTALMSALKDTDQPVILAGDFNGKPDDKSIQALVKAGWKIADKMGGKTFPSDKPRVEIDYVITRGLKNLKTTSTIIDERVASDHRPVGATLTFESNGNK